MDSFHCSYTLTVLFQHATICSNSTVKLAKRCKICSKLAMKTPKRSHWHHYGVFTVNFEHFSYFFLPFLLLIWTGHYLLWMAAQIAFSFCWSVSFDQCHNINCRKLTKTHWKMFCQITLFFIRNIFIRKKTYKTQER